MPLKDNAQTVGFADDAAPGKLQHARVTTHGTPGTAVTLALPTWARGVRMWPRASQIQFGINENPVAPSASLGVGGIAKPDQWEVRILANRNDLVLHLASESASVVVDIEVF